MRFPGMVVTKAAALGLTVASLILAAGSVAQSTAPDTGAQNSAQVIAITDRYLTAVQVELTGRVDTKNAVVGQEVAAKTKDAARLADGTTLPKGTRLVGHVMQVRAGGREEGLAVLALVFDRAELKGGPSVAVRSVIRGVARAGNAAPESELSSPIGPMSSSLGSGVGVSGRTTTRGSVGLGGGGIPGVTAPSRGGTVGATVPSIDGPIGGTATDEGVSVPSIADPGRTSIGGVAADTRSLEGTTTAVANRRVVDAGERTSPAARMTAMPGVMLSNTAVANASGTLTAFGRNISLESGTQITLGVIIR
jgi:hypothetical protein